MVSQLDIIAIGCVAMDYYFILDATTWQDEKMKARFAQLLPGGTMGNFASATAKLAAKTGFLGVVGEDPWGDLLIKDFRELGVDVSRVIRQPDHATPITILLLNREGKRMNILPPFPALQRTDLDLDYIGNAKLLHTHLFDLEVVKYLLREARKRRLILSIDLELHRIKTLARKELQAIISLCDFVFLNHDALLWLASSTNIESTLNSLRRRGPKAIAVTLGEQGCLVVTPKESIRKRSFPVNAVDPTGAGDAYAGAFCFGWLQGWPIEKTVEFASAAAAITVTKVGARAGLPTVEEIFSFLETARASGLLHKKE